MSNSVFLDCWRFRGIDSYRWRYFEQILKIKSIFLLAILALTILKMKIVYYLQLNGVISDLIVWKSDIKAGFAISA